MVVNPNCILFAVIIPGLVIRKLSGSGLQHICHVSCQFYIQMVYHNLPVFAKWFNWNSQPKSLKYCNATATVSILYRRI